MNASNAIAFALIGSLMELLPRAFPAWFPHTGSDEASSRALWLAVMGAVQLTLGLGVLATAYGYPLAGRLFARVPARGAATLPLPSGSGVSVR